MYHRPLGICTSQPDTSNLTKMGIEFVWARPVWFEIPVPDFIREYLPFLPEPLAAAVSSRMLPDVAEFDGMCVHGAHLEPQMVHFNALNEGGE